jgi:hypothetical protein
LFSFATLSAFGDILQIVTSKWTDQQVSDWNVLVDVVSTAIADRNARISQDKIDQLNKEIEVKELSDLAAAQRNQIDQLKRNEAEIERRYERELARSHTLLEATTTQKEIRVVKFQRWGLLGIIVFCLLAGIVAFAWVGRKPNSYKIYVLANPGVDIQDLDGLLEQTAYQPLPSIGDIPVEVKSQRLNNDTTDTVQQIASDLSNRPDTLLVIGKLTSQPTEVSLPIFFGARPQVPVIVTQATDDNLLVQCRNQCSEESDPPLLQLSPTNTAQGKTSVLIARRIGMDHFLIVADNNPSNNSYVQNVVVGYVEAIKSLSNEGAVLAGSYAVNSFNPNDPRHGHYDCVLYAGGLEGAITLLSKYKTPYPVVILSDSVLDGGIGSLSRLPIDQSWPVYFISTIPAADYNARTNPFDRDALSISSELIGDLNAKENGDGFLRWLRLPRGSDARARLVDLIRTNFANRTSYDGVSNRKYVFKGNSRQNGTYYALRFVREGPLSEGKMVELEEQPAASKSQAAAKSLAIPVRPSK